MDGLDPPVGQQLVEQAASDAEPVGGLRDGEKEALPSSIRGSRPGTAMSVAGSLDGVTPTPFLPTKVELATGTSGSYGDPRKHQKLGDYRGHPRLEAPVSAMRRGRSCSSNPRPDLRSRCAPPWVQVPHA
jgi:hypothetical protein